MPIANISGHRGHALLTSTVLLALPGSAVAAGGTVAPLVHDMGISLLIAGMLAVLFHRFKIPSIAAFLVAGFIAGPGGATLVQDLDNIPVIAELGLVLLLFVIGLELDFRKIFSSGRIIIVTGLLQFPLSVVAGFALAKLFAGIGVTALGGDYAPLYMGIVMAASSTLLVVKILQESFQLDTTSGRVSLGLLIFQDIWAIIVIALQPNFSDPQLTPIISAFAGIALLTGVTVLMAHYATPVIFRWIESSPELVLVGAVGWCFGIVFLGASLDQLGNVVFGVSTHIAVGAGMSALIAGASIATLPFSGDVIGKVGVVKDFFVILFFVGLGMGIPVPDGPGVLVLALLFVAAAIAVRYLIFLPLLYFNGLDRRNAFVSSTRLAQVSEFSLVIVYAGVGLGHVDAFFNSAVIFAFVITALLTPLLFQQADPLYERSRPLLDRLGCKESVCTTEEEAEEYSLAVLGFHRLASSLLHELQRQNPVVLKKLLVVDFNAHLHGKISALGATAHYGDLANAETLHHAGVDKAQVVFISVQDDVLKGTSNRRLVKDIRNLNPEAVIIANAIELAESRRLYEAGADFVYLARIDGAQKILDPINRALDGTLGEYRTSREAAEGRPEDRNEVIP